MELERERLRAERLEVERRTEMVADVMEVKPPNRYVPIRDGDGAVSVPYRASSNARRAGRRRVIEVPIEDDRDREHNKPRACRPGR